MNDALHPWVKIYGELAIMYDGRLPDWYQNQTDPSQVLLGKR